MIGDQLYTLVQIQSVLAVVTQSECIDTESCTALSKTIRTVCFAVSYVMGRLC